MIISQLKKYGIVPGGSVSCRAFFFVEFAFVQKENAMETLAFSALPYYNKVTIKDHFIYCLGGNMQKLLEQITTEVAKAFEACEYSADFARVSISNRPDL